MIVLTFPYWSSFGWHGPLLTANPHQTSFTISLGHQAAYAEIHCKTHANWQLNDVAGLISMYWQWHRAAAINFQIDRRFISARRGYPNGYWRLSVRIAWGPKFGSIFWSANRGAR